MPWDTSDRKSELPADWAARRMRVLRRDAYKCRAKDSRGIRCGAPANQVDHISRCANHDEDNLEALCRWHHARKSSAEGNSVHPRRPRQAREPEAHPGLLTS